MPRPHGTAGLPGLVGSVTCPLPASKSGLAAPLADRDIWSEYNLNYLNELTRKTQAMHKI